MANSCASSTRRVGVLRPVVLCALFPTLTCALGPSRSVFLTQAAQNRATFADQNLLQTSLRRGRTLASKLAVPLPNDTVPTAYGDIESAIEAASSYKQPPALGVGFNTFPTATREPFQRVLEASSPTMSDVSAEELAEGEIVSAQADHAAMKKSQVVRPSGSASRTILLPYDMRAGAQLMHSLAEQVTPFPLPSQKVVSESFVSQCPMLMLADELQITAPKCGENLGHWTDPTTGRTILRLEPLWTGGVRFGVDSAIGGKGSTTYATMTQQLTMSGIDFDLMNCLTSCAAPSRRPLRR